MTDLTFAKATADEFRAFWESQGFEVVEYPVIAGYPPSMGAYRATKSEDVLGVPHMEVAGDVWLQLRELRECAEDARGFGLPVSTLGEALEILNELAATRAFGGWADNA